MRVAIIGAGMAGASAASYLVEQGVEVQVIDKGRGMGGRMSTRRLQEGQFDLGAQYFTARSVAFSHCVDKWLSSGSLVTWQPRMATFSQNTGLHASPDEQVRYIGAPAMNAPIKQMLADIPVALSSRITAIERKDGLWQLGEFGPFDAVISTMPPEQAIELWPEEPLLASFQQVMQPCLAIGLQLAEPINAPYDGVFMRDHALSWIARDSSKSGRAKSHDHWLLHASPSWSQAHYDDDAKNLLAQAKGWLQEVFQLDHISIMSNTVHRWRYAKPAPNSPVVDDTYNPDSALAFAGDWLQGGRVEGAWLSGRSAAKQLLQWDARER